MNRTYKTVWNATRGQYVVANEVQKSQKKGGGCLTAIAVAAVGLLSACAAQAAYVEQGVLGDPTSWESAEYNKQWGVAALKSSSAYAMGFNGSGVTIGVMDSGAFLSHPELSGSRFSVTHVTGKFGSSGLYYPQSATTEEPGQTYEKGEAYDMDGNWIPHVNDAHGTSVLGVAGANRDGSEFHGVAWGSNFLVGNTGGNDNLNYGPFQDYDFFYNSWKTMADGIIAANGSRGGVINNSFGTNMRIVKQEGVVGADGDDNSEQLPARTTADSEYEYFYTNLRYGNSPSFVDAAWDAVKGTNVVQIMTTGNRDMENPYYRPLYPYFHPEAEQNWIAVAGVKCATRGDLSTPIDLRNDFNEAGDAKWWTVSAPGDGIYSSRVDVDESSDTFGESTYKSANGTSSAAPHVAGAMGVLMSRYDQMTAVQVRDVLFTTATHKNADGSNFASWTAAEGEVDLRMGWGMPDLDKGMYGPGQLLGRFDYDMAAGSLDVWSNDISETALKQREREELAWMETTENGTNIEAGGDYVLGEDFVVRDGDDDDANHIISLEDAKKWRAQYYAERAAAIQAKIDSGLYKGSLVKRGEGTLVLTGENTYTGGTTVEGGTLLGFTESFGETPVEVNGGRFGLLKTYNDELTMQGRLTSNENQLAKVNVNEGGTLLVTAGEEVQAAEVNFKKGAKIAVSAPDLKAVFQGEAAAGSLSAGSVTGLDLAAADDSMAFFKTTFAAQTPEARAAGTTITATIERNADVTMASVATTNNGRAIAAAVENAAEGAVFDAVLPASREEAAKTFDGLGSDVFLNAQNASIVNTLTLTRAVQDQATGSGSGRSVAIADGSGRLWAAAVGSWGTVDYGNTSIDNDFTAGLIGAEVTVHPSTKVGVFFGAGQSKFKGGEAGKIESNDVHFGLYGVSSVADLVSLNYGVTYSSQDRDMKRSLVLGANSEWNAASGDAKLLQGFVEAVYTGFNTASCSVEPYVGVNWLHVTVDDLAETVGGVAFTTNNETQNLQVATLGVRGAVPFTVGTVPMAVKGNVGWSHFMGDTQSKARMDLGGSGVAVIKGGELENQVNVGLGIEAQLTKSSTLGVAYTGTYDGDVKASGVTARWRMTF